MKTPKTRLLIVEDDPRSLYALKSVLEDRGFDVCAFDDAESAVASGQNHFDAALLDVRLPGDHGPKLASTLRKTRPSIKLIFMTAYNGVREIEDEFPGSTVLVKPLDLDIIIRLIEAPV